MRRSRRSSRRVGTPKTCVNFYRHIRDTHAYLSYAIVPPQIDRSKPAHQQIDPTLYAGVVKENDAGIFLTGGQQLATAAVYSRLRAGELHPSAAARATRTTRSASRSRPTRRASSCMRAAPFALGATNTVRLPAVQPLRRNATASSCWTTCFVPWERVFIYRNLELTRDQWWKTPSHLYGNHQAQARYATKLRFLLGLAKRMNEATGNDAAPPVRWRWASSPPTRRSSRTCCIRTRPSATIDADGILWPSKTALYAVMALQSQINPHMIDIVRELTGAAMITLPSSSKDFDNPEAAADIERYFARRAMGARERIASDAARLGLHRHRVRQPPPAIREVLRRRLVPRENEHVPRLRLRSGGRIGRCRLEFAAARVLTRPLTRKSPSARALGKDCRATILASAL